jgi:hypothetical protein
MHIYCMYTVDYGASVLSNVCEYTTVYSVTDRVTVLGQLLHQRKQM